MKYTKKESVGGEWVRASELENGTKIEILSEATTIGGEFGDRDVCKVKVAGFDEEKNVNLNKTTLNGFIDAFGDESEKWIGKTVTAQVEKALIGGKRVTILYMIPEGCELKENEDGYLHVVPNEE